MGKSRPILFSGPLVRAILDGRKTQTRRAVKPQPDHLHAWHTESPTRYEAIAPSSDGRCSDQVIPCPYGERGDRLWVRETWRPEERDADGIDGIRFAADKAFVPIENTIDAADAWCDVYHRPGKPDRWRPSIHMPRWASRIDLGVTEVRVERLQEITAEGVAAEGVDLSDIEGEVPGVDFETLARARFAKLWDDINGARAPWASNPWVWVVAFRVLRPTPND